MNAILCVVSALRARLLLVRKCELNSSLAIPGGGRVVVNTK